MKIVMRFLFAVMFLCLMNACITKKVNFQPIHRQWMLVEFQNYSRAFLLSKEAQLDLSLTKSPKNQYRADMGCGNIFMNAVFENNGTCEFTNIRNINSYCVDNMQLENNFEKALATMKFFSVKGHTLELSDGKGSKMKFTASDWD